MKFIGIALVGFALVSLAFPNIASAQCKTTSGGKMQDGPTAKCIDLDETEFNFPWNLFQYGFTKTAYQGAMPESW